MVRGMDRVVVVATLTVKEGMEDRALEILRPVVDGTHTEAGCLTYALHRDNNDPLTFVIIEHWTSQVALDNHFVQPHMAELATHAAELLAAPPVVRFCSPLGLGDSVKGTL